MIIILSHGNNPADVKPAQLYDKNYYNMQLKQSILSTIIAISIAFQTVY